jgi:RHS repeat-associated protein
MIDDSPMGDQYCSQNGYATLFTDRNGNQMSLRGLNNATVDTLGRQMPLFASGPTFDPTDSSGCSLTHPFVSSTVYYYNAPDGTLRSIKVCVSQINVHTAFNQSYAGIAIAEFVSSTSSPAYATTTIILADGTKWTFDYDSYGELAYVGLPTGGSITYTWTTINYTNCNIANMTTPVSRAVAGRMLNDGQGHTLQWNYTWGSASASGQTNVVTDPLGNDSVHTFTAMTPPGNSSPPGCNLYETTTIDYQGGQSANHPLQRVDTTYSSIYLQPDAFGGGGGVGNVFATDVVTTVYPSGKVKKIHKDPDTGLGAGQPIFGNVKKELEYDWGQGAPGALLRETDTTYQWELSSAYRTAGLLDLPASVVVKDVGGNRAAETDYTYDEPNYLTTPTPTITTQHTAPPYGVRGNLTTTSRWLNTSNSFVATHTNWYDTGEAYQAIDPLGHTTTYSYDPFYVAAYLTQTCSPATGSFTHCVSGTYDFNTGFLTSLTNENATTQASGNTPGDSAHTSNYTYDPMFRLTSGQAPPDPANGSLRAQNTFTFSAPNTFPISVQRTRSVTSTLSDSASNTYDGLGRVFKTQHTLPNGTATVDSTFDVGGHVATVSNPYFSTSDPTYGTVANIYDGLDRVTQVTRQDGSISKVQYSIVPTISVNGDCTITADEAGNQRGACTDALGRLVEVDEPNPGGATLSVNYHATMQTDGNFVLANSSGLALWSGGAPNGQIIEMQDDGNLVMYHQLWQAGTYRAPSGATSPYDSCSVGPVLNSGGVPHDGQCLESHSGMTFALMTNGDLQIYDRQLGQVTWHSNTYGHPGAYAILQSPDGNFVIYDANGNYLWASWSFGATLAELEDDGRLIIYNPVWSSGTSQGFAAGSYTHPSCDAGIGTGWTGVLSSGQCFVSRNGRYELLIQSDGNMVIYDRSVTPNAALWSTKTTVSPADPGFAMRTLYAYDVLGNLIRVDQWGTAPNDSTQWRTRTFTYDSLSRLLTATNPESGTISYLYDNDGELLQKTSPAPNQQNPAVTQTISYCYDELHRVTGKAYGALSCPLTSPVVSYAYDSGANAKGHLTQMTDQAGTASYSYDILGQLSSETRTLMGVDSAGNSKPVSQALSYDYNLDGSLKALHYPSGAVIANTPDSAGRVASAVDSTNNINYVTQATYGPDSALTGFLSGSGGPATFTNSFSYNKRLQPLTMSASTGNQTVFSIGYDFHAGNGTSGSGTDNGNVYGIYNYRDHNRDQTFTYDPLNRLLTAQNAGTNCSAATLNGKTEYWGNSYSYDAWGNLLGKTVTKCGAENLSVTADAHNWIHSSGTDYQYDRAGNMTHDATANLDYHFDQENRLTGAAGYTYTYDGDGNRVIKSSGNTASSGTLYWYMTPGVIAESDLAGTLKSEYVFFDGERVARRDNPGTPSATVAYYFSDHLKTASVITDAAGTIKAESDYYPWGGELQFVANDANDYKFTGKKRDAETGLDYFGARYYSNGLARWVSADWSATPVPVPYADFGNPQSLNLYQFVGGNPASKADLDGHCFWDACVAETYLVITGAVALTAAALSTPAGHQAIKSGYEMADHATTAAANGLRSLFSRTSKAHAPPAPTAGAVPGTQTGTQTAAKPKDVYIDPSKYPASAGHAGDAIAAGKPDVLTVNRPGSADNRADAMSGTKPQPGADRDEYPPAVTKEGGAGASVRPIPAGDNRGAGGSLGQQIKDVPNGGRIKINVRPKPRLKD